MENTAEKKVANSVGLIDYIRPALSFLRQLFRIYVIVGPFASIASS